MNCRAVVSAVTTDIILMAMYLGLEYKLDNGGVSSFADFMLAAYNQVELE